MATARKLKPLEATLGFNFKSRALLNRALTHASIHASRNTKKRGDNERLEFLGDRVLGLAVAELLAERFPMATEGELARRFNLLVRGEACARIARTIGLGQAMILSDAEAGSGGRDKETILADAVEALLGAIFLEGGFDAARDVVRKLWTPMLDAAPQMIADPKSALQEWAQGNGLALPVYVEVGRDGPDHQPRFTAEVRVKGLAPAQGIGASKRAAEQAAAQAMLAREGVGGLEKDD